MLTASRGTSVGTNWWIAVTPSSVASTTNPSGSKSVAESRARFALRIAVSALSPGTRVSRSAADGRHGDVAEAVSVEQPRPGLRVQRTPRCQVRFDEGTVPAPGAWCAARHDHATARQTQAAALSRSSRSAGRVGPFHATAQEHTVELAGRDGVEVCPDVVVAHVESAGPRFVGEFGTAVRRRTRRRRLRSPRRGGCPHRHRQRDPTRDAAGGIHDDRRATAGRRDRVRGGRARRGSARRRRGFRDGSPSRPASAGHC